MKGSPLKETVFLFVALLGFSWPLYEVISNAGLSLQREDLSARESFDSDYRRNEENTVAAFLTLKTAHRAEHITVHYSQKSFPKKTLYFTSQEGEVTEQINLVQGEELDLLVQAKWKESIPETALMVQLDLPGEQSRQWTFWGEGYLVEERVEQIP